jgi:5-methylthioadenosine/S-adenosylhomocysteine deaminase
MLQGQEASLLLRGDIVTPDGIARDRYILVREGRIAEISRRRPARTENVRFLETRRGEWIFPGLINLHTHATYNFLPLWRSPASPFANRFEWRQDSSYKKEVGGFARDFAKRDGMREIISVFGELQAVAGGTAILQEDFALDAEKKLGGLLLCRDTASPEDFGLPPDRQIMSVVDFFQPGPNGAPRPLVDRIQAYRKARDAGSLVSTIVHLAEGRSGFGSNRGVDPYSRAEFEAFMALPEVQDAQAVRSSPFAIVHGCGVDARNPAHIAFLRDRNISLIWSPVSNLLLYGDTLDVETFLAGGINVALGSDWAPSGSKHVWDEAKFARSYFQAIGSPVSDALIFEMVTINAARCLGMDHAGRISEGSLADFFILRSPIETDNAHEIFLGTEDKDVLATIIAGEPIYGDRETLSPFASDLQPLPAVEGSAVRNKAVRLPPQLAFDVDARIGDMEKALKACAPPVWRSNLLVSSDKLYRRRIQRLRAELQDYGWGVRQWRHDGPSATPGLVPVAPGAVRVWQGYRNALSHDALRENMGRVLVPGAVNLQAPLGLTACLAALLPEGKDPAVPDAVGLDVFETRLVADRTPRSAAGRTFALLGGALFDRERSAAAFATPFTGALAAGKPVHLLAGTADWQAGVTEVFVGSKPDAMPAEAFLAALSTAASALQSAPPPGLDGAIVSASEDHVVWWQHWRGEPDKTAAVALRLAGIAVACLDTRARTAKSPPLYWEADGVPIAPGDALNLVFQRRAATPW